MFQQIEHDGNHFSGGLASGLLHSLLVALILSLSPAILKRATAVRRSLIYLAPPLERTPKLKHVKPLPAPRSTETKIVFTPRTPAPETPKPLIEPPALLASTPVKPAAIPAPHIVAVVPPPPIQTNLFRQLNAVLAPQSSPVPVRDAGFDHKANLVVSQEAPSAAFMTRTGFDQAPNAQPVVPSGMVQTGRFSSERETAVLVTQGSTAKTSFDRQPASASAPEKMIATNIARSKAVEILDKPRPRYTEEALKAKIEGTVYIEVTFTAGGQIQVHRVVKGLPYGLDQSAVEAAQQIRFRPATLNGAPVDQTATVQVLFQISE